MTYRIPDSSPGGHKLGLELGLGLGLGSGSGCSKQNMDVGADGGQGFQNN